MQVSAFLGSAWREQRNTFRFSPGFVFFFLELDVIWDIAQIGLYIFVILIHLFLCKYKA